MSGRWRRLSTSSLGLRLGGMLVLALMPLGVLAVAQTCAAIGQAERMTLTGIGGAALEAVQPQIDLIREAQMTARIQGAALSAVMPPDAECSARMAAIARTMPQATHLAYVPMSGLSTCSSTGGPVDFTANPLFARLTEAPEPRLGFNPRGLTSGAPVISASHPVLAASGQQVGVVVVSILYQAVAQTAYQGDYGQWTPQIVATVTSDGTILAGAQDRAQVEALLPAALTLDQLGQAAGGPRYLDTGQGPRRILSVTPVSEGLTLLAIWQQAGTGWFQGPWAAFLLPVLTWAAALIAAVLASGRLVVRHVRGLARAMTTYMDRRARLPVPAITEAPTEIRALHAVYEQLIATIEQDEAELQNLLVDKETLLREVHHRSGNSLQIIASVIRMYRRETPDPALRAVLDGLVNRVMALSSTHTSLYGFTGCRDVPMDEILSGVIRRLKQIHNIPKGAVQKHFAPIAMPAQYAVPLALALAEAVGCLFTAPAGGQGIDVALSQSDDTIRLVITGPVVPEFLPETTRGIPALPRIMLRQYAAQLRGRLEIRIHEGRTILELSIPAQTLVQAG